MKLTKTQRLFMKAGIEMCNYAYYKWVDTCDNCDVLHEIAEHRKKYKKLIRKALEAWNDEADNLYLAGYQTCFKSMKEWGATQHRNVNRNS